VRNADGIQVLEYLDANFDELRLLRVKIEPDVDQPCVLDSFPFLAILIVLEGRGTMSVQNDAVLGDGER